MNSRIRVILKVPGRTTRQSHKNIVFEKYFK